MSEVKFFTAICDCDIETLKILLKKNPDLILSRHFNSGQSCLDFCFEKKHDDDRHCKCLELLVNHGADINEKCDRRHEMHHSWTPIMIAVHVKCLRCLKFLIAKGAELSIKASLGATALIHAVQKREFTSVEILIQHSSTELINHKDHIGMTALMCAAECNEDQAPSVCRQLIEAGADVSITNRDGETALILAVMMCRGRCADVLIQHSNLELLNHRDNFGRTALMWAARCRGKDALSLIQKLIEAGADVTLSDKDGHSALIHAVKNNNLVLAKYLIHISTPELINHRDNSGRCALMWAAICLEKDANSIIYKLLEAGVDAKISDENGQTALMSAIELHGQNAHSLIQKLIEAGADVKMSDKNGYTALILAIVHNNVILAEYLIQRSTPELINRRDILGMTALSCTADCDRHFAPFLSQKLTEAGADANIPDFYGTTALIHAVQKREEGCAEMLIQLSTLALINHKDNGGRTALMWAILDYKSNFRRYCDHFIHIPYEYCIDETAKHQLPSWRISLCEHLIEAGADVNLRDNDGETALSFALEKKDENVVSFLLEKGAFVNNISISGKTPLYQAFWVKNWSLLNQLLIKGADPTLSFRHECFIHYSIKNNSRATLRTLVLNGFPSQDCTVSNNSFLSSNCNLQSVSPLSLALWKNKPAIARYFITNKFFTLSDINQTLAQNTGLRQRLSKFETNECLQILEFHLQTVQTLSTLCLITISSALTQDFREDNNVRGTSSANWRFTPTFKERVETLGLPPKIKRALLHQTPSSKICCKEWENISLEEERQFSDCNECGVCTGSSDLNYFHHTVRYDTYAFL